MSENTQETRSIEDLIKLIESEKLLLPEFQRNFKWPIEKTVTLFDSFNRNLFIGSLILARPKFDLACKKFDIRERGSKNHRPKPTLIKKESFEQNDWHTLLDGQQRATSIYRALLGVDNIYYWFQPFSVLSSDEFYDKKENKSKVSLEKYISNVDLKPPKDDVLYIKVSDLYKSLDGREQRFIDDFITPQLDEFNVSEEDRDIAIEFAGALFSDFKTDIIKKDKLLSVQLLNMPLEKFCLFFERSNSQGMNLSFVDIINAKVYIDFKLNQAIAKAKKNTYIDENIIDPLVRYINYISNGEVTKDSILSDLTGQNLIDHWNTCVKDIDYIQKWLEENDWLFDVTKMPYRTMLLPLLSFYQNLPNKEFSQASSEQLNQLKYWFYISLLDNRYGGGGHGSTNVVIKKDADILKELAQGKNIDKEFWARIRIISEFEDYKRMDNAKSASFMGLSYFLWNSTKFRNFENDAAVSMGAKVDVHHVFPVNYIKKKYGETSNQYDFVDTVLNKVRINKISNIKIGDKAPSIYLNELLKSHNKDLLTSLESHNINCGNELLNGRLDTDFFAFIEMRFKEFEKSITVLKSAGEKLARGETSNIW
ncbi:DUF262 domain-containing protein [Pseudoalteromonas sp. NZS11_1]|uniref:DUF262 domain-containing protein n=1 Tax=Pseudoalteromonas sp. NZS11_1 TaxID=2792070 RepID=UPI0018CFE265|nr:DUF262 domain-containing protein [Pseudoalteromonas sp. NZS11_1]MBH0048421.1 DUF262 domain-containing protein [Pseudoalteromonas sp. NZS11_1]